MANGNSSTASGFLGLVGLVVGVLLFFLVLNYFNIISLSQLYPNLFGFLPHESTTNQSTQPTTQKITFACPVAKEFCKSGKEIYDGDQFLGIAYNLPIPTKFYAAISGLAVFGGAEDKSKNILSHAKIVIGGIGISQGYVATYDYFGFPVTDKQELAVSQDDHIGGLYGGSFPKEAPFNGINLLVKITTNTGQDVKVTEFE